MVDQLVNFVGHLGHWGYLVIFLVVALECQAILGLVMPGESLVLVGGFFAEQGVFDLAGLILVISLAAILGDSIGYELGRYLGRGGCCDTEDVSGCVRSIWRVSMDSLRAMAAKPFSAVIFSICYGH